MSTKPVAWAIDDRLDGGTIRVPLVTGVPVGDRQAVDRVRAETGDQAIVAVPLYPATAEQHLDEHASALERIAYWSARACRADLQGRQTADASMDLDMAQDELDKAIDDYTGDEP